MARVLSVLVVLVAVLSPHLSPHLGRVAAGEFCAANAELKVGRASGFPGQLVSVQILGSSVCDIQAVSLGISHDPAVVRFVQATRSSFLLANGGATNLVVQSDNAQGWVAIRYSNSFFPRVTFPLPTDTPLFTVTYRIFAAVPIGQAVTLRNLDRAFGNPPVQNQYAAPGGAIDPQLVDGEIFIGTRPPEERFELRMAGTTGTTVPFLSTRRVEVRASATMGLAGFKAVVGYDPALLRVVAASFDGTVWQNAAVQEIQDDGLGSLRLEARDATVAAGENLLFATVDFESVGCVGPAGVLFGAGTRLTDAGLTDHDATNDLDLSGVSLVVERPRFVRGNGDDSPVPVDNPSAAVNFVDGMFVLFHLFAGGSPPACEDAADANDDGNLNIVDVIWIFQMLLGTAPIGPELPPPFHVAAPDATPDGLGCRGLADGDNCL